MAIGTNSGILHAFITSLLMNAIECFLILVRVATETGIVELEG